jgi:enoyl-CoA hydratase/carnithine racemase
MRYAVRGKEGAMDATNDVRIERLAGVLAITLARPQKKNALTAAMYRQLLDALALASVEPSIRAVLLDGEGSDFCAGNDIADFILLARQAASFEQSDVWRFLTALLAFDKPLVAAVRGRAVGIGATLLLHCDLVYVADNVSLSTPFVDLALVPEAAASLLLPARIGYARAFALFALGEALDARAAVDLGLANAALPAEEVTPRARAAALALAGKPAQALQATKKLMREHARMQAIMAAEGREFAQRLVSAEAQATFQAFMARPARGG